jgi:hypothetical protein
MEIYGGFLTFRAIMDGERLEIRKFGLFGRFERVKYQKR